MSSLDLVCFVCDCVCDCVRVCVHTDVLSKVSDAESEKAAAEKRAADYQQSRLKMAALSAASQPDIRQAKDKVKSARACVCVRVCVCVCVCVCVWMSDLFTLSTLLFFIFLFFFRTQTEEGELNFPPTYRYERGTRDVYKWEKQKVRTSLLLFFVCICLFIYLFFISPRSGHAHQDQRALVVRPRAVALFPERVHSSGVCMCCMCALKRETHNVNQKTKKR